MTRQQAESLRANAERFGFALAGEAVDRLDRFLALLALWNSRIRLTGDRDLNSLIHKHTVDSLAPAGILPAAGLVVDVGSGAGFPGIVLACVRPDLSFVLIESRRRRASFLREASRTLALPHARIAEMRAEAAAADTELAGRAAVTVARALDPSTYFATAAPLLAPGGTAIAMQTPRSARAATAAAIAHGLRIRETREYVLPGGERRALLALVRASEY